MSAIKTQVAARSFIEAEVRADRIPAGATSNLDLFTIPAGASVGLIKWTLKEPFADATGTITAVTASVGDEDGATGYILAKSVWGADSPVTHAQSDGPYAEVEDDDSNTALVPGSFKLYSDDKAFRVAITKTGAGNATARFLKGKLLLTVEILQPRG